MRIEIRHFLPCTAERYWEIFWNPEYDRRLDEAAGTRHEIVREWQEDGRRCWETRYRAVEAQEEGIARLLGGGLLEFDQINRLDQDQGELRWEVRPRLDVVGSLSASGVISIRPRDGGVERHVVGDVEVGIPFVGGSLESAICRSIERSYERDVEVIEAWLAAPPDRG
jgi:hypothetical protein